MRKLIVCLVIIVSCAGCATNPGRTEARFEWYNLSTNEIWLREVVGLPSPANAPDGVLIPKSAEVPHENIEAVVFETARIKNRITIKWKDNGRDGWPGGLKQPGTVPPGVSHEAEFKRANLGIPEKFRTGTVGFTYLGGDKWRVKVLEQ